MKSLHRIAIAAPLIVLHAWAGEIPSKQIAARTELHQIQTLTLSDQQFLNGDTGGKPVTITDVEVTEYPSAAHAFDNPLGAQPAAVSPKFESVRNCKIREETEGLLINAETKQPFSYKDACVVHGPHLGCSRIIAQVKSASRKQV